MSIIFHKIQPQPAEEQNIGYLHEQSVGEIASSELAAPVGSDARTVNKMLKFSVPPGYWRWKPPVKPKLGPFIAIMDAILAEDKSRSKK